MRVRIKNELQAPPTTAVTITAATIAAVTATVDAEGGKGCRRGQHSNGTPISRILCARRPRRAIRDPADGAPRSNRAKAATQGAG